MALDKPTTGIYRQV